MGPGDLNKRQKMTDESLAAAAHNLALAVQSNVDNLESALLKLETEKQQIEAKLDAARRVLKRSVDFQPRIGKLLQCPSCWIRGNDRVPLSQFSSAKQADIHKCRICGWAIVVPLNDEL
jgi:hypothetical protein